MVKSPINHSTNVSIVKSLDRESIINRYKKHYSIDISNIIGKKDVRLYKCNESGLYFFQPNDIAGDGKFYEQLQAFEWYYIPWKWEHEYCISQCSESDNILEIGCGSGGFVRELTRKGYKIQGLELNEKAVKQLKDEGYEVENVLVQEYAKNNFQKFDVVCSFQVLEHVADVKTFLDGAIQCLKPNGRLILAVPNNDSFIKYNENSLLNQPPHHMGLWTKDSLTSLQNYFDVEFKTSVNEPLQPQHFNHFYYTLLKRYLGHYIAAGLNKLTFTIAKPLIKKFHHKIDGECIIAIYTKK